MEEPTEKSEIDVKPSLLVAVPDNQCGDCLKVMATKRSVIEHNTKFRCPVNRFKTLKPTINSPTEAKVDSDKDEKNVKANLRDTTKNPATKTEREDKNKQEADKSEKISENEKKATNNCKVSN